MIKKKLYEALSKRYNKPRAGIHVSDLLYCPRKNCFRKLDPQITKDEELNMFTSGKAIEQAVVELCKEFPDEFEFQKTGYWNGITYSIDVWNKANNYPIEIKSYRGKSMDKPKPHYIDQLEAYMALTHSDYGEILVQCLLHFDGDEGDAWLEFEHHMGPEDRTQVLAKLSKDAAKLKMGLEYKNPAFVRHIAYEPSFIDKRGVNWTCKKCHWLEQCTEMRNKENGEKLKK